MSTSYVLILLLSFYFYILCKHKYLFTEPKACGRPEQPPNSTMIAPAGFDVSATVDYACDDGHLLVGPSARKCLETGFYNEFPPVCKCKFNTYYIIRSKKIENCFIVHKCRYRMWFTCFNTTWFL